MVRIKRQDILKYIFAAVGLLLSSFAMVNRMMLPFALGLYAAFVYCRLNIAVISPLYIFTCLLNDLSLQMLLYRIIPVAVFLLARYFHHLAKKPINIIFALIYTLISILPQFYFAQTFENKVYLAISIVVILIFAYISMSFLYAMLVRSTVFSLSADEKASGFIVVSVLSLGLYSIQIYGFSLYYLVVAFGLMYFIFNIKDSISCFLVAAISIGAALGMIDSSPVGGILIMFFIGRAFKKLNKYVTAVAIVLADVVCGIYFNCFYDYTYLHIIAVSIGVLCYVVLPKKVTRQFLFLRENEQNNCALNVIKREKLELVKKLNMAEKVIYELANNYEGKRANNIPREEVVRGLSKDVVLHTCALCNNKDFCFKTANMSPEIAMRTVIDGALISGKAVVSDFPSYLNSKCNNIQGILSYTNSITQRFLAKIEQENGSIEDNRFLSTQMFGIGSILGTITEDIKNVPIIDQTKEEKLIAELGYNNIICREALFLEEKDKNVVILVVREQDKNSALILQVIDKLLKDTLYKIDEELSLPHGDVCLYFESCPQYDLTFYNVSISKDGALYCGDSHSIVKIKENKVLVILCDGMGTGQAAQDTSMRTLSLVQNFYKAGLDSPKALVLINRALAYTNKENFTALDMCVIDLNYGSVDFIKLGAVPGFIRKQEGVVTINCGALPLGIVDNATPTITREVLAINDIVVLVSDGVLDVLKKDGIKEILLRINSSNPKTVCEEILGHARNLGLHDDSTVIAYKLFRKRRM